LVMKNERSSTLPTQSRRLSQSAQQWSKHSSLCGQYLELCVSMCYLQMISLIRDSISCSQWVWVAWLAWGCSDSDTWVICLRLSCHSPIPLCVFLNREGSGQPKNANRHLVTCANPKSVPG
jgi:hypothetical protein